MRLNAGPEMQWGPCFLEIEFDTECRSVLAFSCEISRCLTFQSQQLMTQILHCRITARNSLADFCGIFTDRNSCISDILGFLTISDGLLAAESDNDAESIDTEDHVVASTNHEVHAARCCTGGYRSEFAIDTADRRGRFGSQAAEDLAQPLGPEYPFGSLPVNPESGRDYR